MLYGDVPLISVDTLTRLLAAKPQGGIGLLTVKLDDPSGYGRIVREQGDVVGIVEHKDASEAQRQINEINTGILVANGRDLKRWLGMLNNDNAQGEFYITDIIALAHADGKKSKPCTHRVERSGRREQPTAAGDPGARVPVGTV